MLRSLALALALVSPALQAGDVYVWTDGEGRRQISDVVPGQYRAKARKIEVPAEAAAASAAAGGSAAPVRQEAPAAADCVTRWERYLDSSECVAFYEYALRGLAADPRANCPVVPAPPQDCPPPPEGISRR